MALCADLLFTSSTCKDTLQSSQHNTVDKKQDPVSSSKHVLEKSQCWQNEFMDTKKNNDKT